MNSTYAALRVDGRHIAVLERGDGPPVVLVHASGSSVLQWGPVAPRLADRWRVYAPDLLGCGQSDAWPDPDHYTTDADVAVVCAVVRHAYAERGPVQLVGHSFGGVLAMRVAEQLPECVRALAAFEPVAFGVLGGSAPEAEAEMVSAADPHFLDAATGGNEAWLRAFIDWWGVPGTWDALPEPRRNALRATGRKSFLEVRALLEDTRPADAWKIGCPSLWMTGTRSPRPAQAVCRTLADTLPGARLSVFEGGGHMAPVEEAKRFVRTLAAWFEETA